MDMAAKLSPKRRGQARAFDPACAIKPAGGRAERGGVLNDGAAMKAIWNGVVVAESDNLY